MYVWMYVSEPPRTSPQQDAAVTGGPLPPPPPSSQQPQPYIQVSLRTYFLKQSRSRLLNFEARDASALCFEEEMFKIFQY